MNKNLVKKLATVCVSASMFLSSFAAFAAGETNTLQFDTYFKDEAVTTVFVGEEIKTVLSLTDFANIDVFDIILRYDDSVLALYDSANSAEITEECAFNSCGAITLGDKFTNLSNVAKNKVYPTNGLMLLAAESTSNTAVTDKTDFITFSYKVKSAGDATMRFANENDYDLVFDIADYDMESSNPFGYYFIGDTDIETTAPATASVIAYDAPENAANPVWADVESATNFNVSWEAPATGCRGYIVTVYYTNNEGDTQSKTLDTIEELTTNLNDIVVEYGPGSYQFGVRAKGGANDSPDEVLSETKEVSQIPMASVEASYDEETDTLTWKQVENASGYTIIITNTATGAEEKIPVTMEDGKTTYSYEKLVENLEVGDYTVKVVATPENDLYSSYDEPATNCSTGSTVNGKISFLGTSGKAVKSNFVVKVTLTSDSNVYEGTADASGNFAIAGVKPGEYTVTLSGNGIVSRTMQNSDRDNLILTLDKSEVKTISKENSSLGVFIGNIDIHNSLTINAVNGYDLNEILTAFWAAEGDDEYKADYDFIADEDPIIVEELDVIIANYGKGLTHYRALEDYANLEAAAE